MKLIPEYHMVPYAVEVTYGTSSSSVSDIQVQYDGNTFDLEELATTPGLQMIVSFKNVLRFSKIGISAYYSANTTSHYVAIEIYNWENGEWEVYATIPPGLGMNYRYFDTQDYEEHIKNGEVKMRLNHPMGGSAAHDFYIDYMALIR